MYVGTQLYYSNIDEGEDFDPQEIIESVSEGLGALFGTGGEQVRVTP